MSSVFANFAAGTVATLLRLNNADGIAFKPYAYADEDFLGPHYVACHSSRDDIVEHLRCPAL